MVATFCFIRSASRFDARVSPTSGTVAPASSTSVSALFTWLILLLILLILCPVGLPRASDELELAPLHQLLEHAEFGLLRKVEDLVNRLVRLLGVGDRARIDVLQFLHSLFELRFVRLGRDDETAQFADDACALLERFAASLLESFVTRQELREVRIIDLQLLLRL